MEDGIVERRVGGAYYERNLYEDTSKQASLLLEPQEGHSGYAIRGLVNFTHQIEPVASLERSSNGQAHRLSRITTGPATCGNEDVSEEQPQESPEPRKADRVAYATIFLHSVGLRLSQLDPPIAVVVTAIQGSFTDNESYVSHYEGGRIDASGTLKKLAEHFNKESNMKNADAILMAAGQACRLHKTSIAQDKPGKFNGINTAAHEIGHLLGAYHDGDKNKIAQNCSANGRYLMSKHGGGFDFSKCSKELIADFVTICIILHFVSLQVESDLSECRLRCLLVPEKGKARNGTAFALDGTPCNASDPKKVCKNSICV
ncbi:hypothetical protein V5799_016997 [Amblyomma americanum]|uniref:Uncharacterized protein n=1 Tax=Amblyomma americanum TaxID=6943 RepID=A0AAQ4F4J9_AMBAM